MRCFWLVFARPRFRREKQQVYGGPEPFRDSSILPAEEVLRNRRRVGVAVGRVKLVKAFRFLFVASAIALSGGPLHAASGDAVPVPAAKPDSRTVAKPA